MFCKVLCSLYCLLFLLVLLLLLQWRFLFPPMMVRLTPLSCVRLPRSVSPSCSNAMVGGDFTTTWVVIAHHRPCRILLSLLVLASRGGMLVLTRHMSNSFHHDVRAAWIRLSRFRLAFLFSSLSRCLSPSFSLKKRGPRSACFPISARAGKRWELNNRQPWVIAVH